MGGCEDQDLGRVSEEPGMSPLCVVQQGFPHSLHNTRGAKAPLIYSIIPQLKIMFFNFFPPKVVLSVGKFPKVSISKRNIVSWSYIIH